MIRDSYGKTEYNTSGSISEICSKIKDKELNQALQDLSDSIDKSYKNSGVYEFIKRKYRKIGVNDAFKIC